MYLVVIKLQTWNEKKRKIFTLTSFDFKYWIISFCVFKFIQGNNSDVNVCAWSRFYQVHECRHFSYFLQQCQIFSIDATQSQQGHDLMLITDLFFLFGCQYHCKADYRNSRHSGIISDFRTKYAYYPLHKIELKINFIFSPYLPDFFPISIIYTVHEK